LAARAARPGAGFRFHYVTAREMANLALAAEAGWTGAVADALDYAISNPFEQRSCPPEVTPVIDTRGRRRRAATMSRSFLDSGSWMMVDGCASSEG
jgi:hypothetical protein